MSQALPARFLQYVQAGDGRALPPVERWNPDYCGEIDMRIASDGCWYYQGTIITRMLLVRLFASILRRDSEQYVLVTPVERVGITVDDLPFLAVDMERHEGAAGESLTFRTNLDDIIALDADHPLRFDIGAGGAFRPKIRVRHNLWARLTRALAIDLAELLVDGSEGPGLHAGGLWFPLDSRADP